MNRNEVVTIIKTVGAHFCGKMAVACGKEFTAGYERAVADMMEVFSEANISPDYEAEREAMLAHIKALQARNDELENEVCEKHATIQKLLSYVNIAEVLGVETPKRDERKEQRRGIAFIFR